MKYQFLKACLLIAWSLLSGTEAASAMTTQAIENTGNLCAAQTVRAEREKGIPRHLLTAISLAESGFWNAARRENVAWPWTVTSASRSWYFASKEDAVTQVLELWADGVTNIDVGCMQINLHYHGAAFRDLEQAFDPFSNVAYASRFLKNLYTNTRSWTQAAAFYHSTTPERNRPYKLKVIKIWNEVRQSSGAGYAQSSPSANRRLVHIDRERTEKLNARLRASRSAARGSDQDSAPGGAKETVRQGQLAAWRSGDGGPSGGARLAAMRRAELETQRMKVLRGQAQDETGQVFAAKRTAQLNFWRRNVADAAF